MCIHHSTLGAATIDGGNLVLNDHAVNSVGSFVTGTGGVLQVGGSIEIVAAMDM